MEEEVRGSERGVGVVRCYGIMMGVSEKTDIMESVSPALCRGCCSAPSSNPGPRCPGPALSLPFCCSLIGSRNTTCLLVLTLRPGPSVLAGGVGVRMEDWALPAPASFPRLGVAVAGGGAFRHGGQRQGVR